MNRFNEDTYLDNIFELDSVSETDVPESLLDRLEDIPMNAGVFVKHRRYFAIAAAVLLSFLIFNTTLLRNQPQSFEEKRLTAEELKTKQQMALAFHYVDRSNKKLSQNIHSTISHNLQQHTLVPAAEPAYSAALLATKNKNLSH